MAVDATLEGRARTIDELIACRAVIRDKAAAYRQALAVRGVTLPPARADDRR